jgi:radical SAM protein with 4Fe4S-binding SPASM domain
MIDKNKIDPNNGVFCSTPWLVLNIRQDGRVTPCCVCEYNYGNINEKSLWEIWNDEPIKKFRESMVNGTPHKNCQACYNNQAAEKISIREEYNQILFDDKWSNYRKFIYETNDDYSVNEPGFVFWDLKLSNKCNFKCRMCSWASSSSFELEQFGKISGNWDAAEKTYEEVEPFIKDVNHLYFSGGEALIVDEHWKIMDKLIELRKNNNVTVSYNSNFSNLVYKGRHIFDLWDQFNRHLEVHISIDGVGARGELIRKGFKWDRFVSHAEQFRDRFKNKEHTHELHFDCTVQALNIFDIVTLHQYLYNSGLMKDIDFFFLNFLQTPREQSVWILDKKTKEDAKENIRNHIDNFLIPNKSKMCVGFYESLITYIDLYQEQKLIPQFLDSMRRFDKIRDENIIETFPEFQRIWNVIKTKPKT